MAYVLQEKRGHVAILTMNRPEVLNATDDDAFEELIAVTEQVDADDDIYAVILTGAGRAFLAGGETVVQLTGKGKGGRNQELALSAASGIDGIVGAAVFSVGSDGTDGPTDAAGGYVDYTTAGELKAQGVDIYDILQQNDAYHALEKVGGLVITGPTGTNVNDVAVALLKA